MPGSVPSTARSPWTTSSERTAPHILRTASSGSGQKPRSERTGASDVSRAKPYCCGYGSARIPKLRIHWDSGNPPVPLAAETGNNLNSHLRSLFVSCHTVYMTFPATTDDSTWTIRIGRTDGEFLVGVENGYDDDGFRFEYEYTYLDYNAEVDVRLERSGESISYANALAQVRGYVAAVAHTSLIVSVNAGRCDGWSFIAGGWMTPAECLAWIDGVASKD